MKQHLKVAGVTTILLTLLIVGVALAANVSVDNFANLSQTILYTLDGSEPYTDAGRFGNSTSAIGGHRDLCLYVETGNTEANARIQASQVNQYLLFALDPSVTGIGSIQWDGTEASCTTINTNGLAGANVVDTGNTGFVVRIISSDAGLADITIQVYENGTTDWQELTLPVPASVTTGEVVDVFFPFTNFGGGSGSVDFTNLGAVVLILDGTLQEGKDLIVKYLTSTGSADYGDLPDTGVNAFDALTRAASHLSQGLRFGNNVDTENTATASATATGDDAIGAPDDEDGISRDMTDVWTPGASVDLRVDVNGCTGTCRMNGWIDWNQDGDFGDTNEQIINEQAISNGDAQNFTIAVDNSGAYTTGDDVFVRFRICSTTGNCNSPTATAVLNGEIEDYFWGFGPTAVTLETLSVRNTNNMVAIGVAGVLLLTGTVFLLRLRRPTVE